MHTSHVVHDDDEGDAEFDLSVSNEKEEEPFSATWSLAGRRR